MRNDNSNIDATLMHESLHTILNAIGSSCGNTTTATLVMYTRIS